MGRQRAARARRAAVTGVALLALGCLPDRELSSYAAGEAVGRGAVSNAAAPAPAPVRSGAPPGAPGESSAAAGAPRDAGAPAPALTSATVEADAALLRALTCQTGCDCERRDERDFMFCATALSFADAGALCAEAGGTLASVDDAELNDWLTEQMEERSADDFWLSGTDEEDEGVWRWADGRVFFPSPADAGEGFAPWDDQQPNDLNGEDCMRSVGGVWRDLSCDEVLTVVCQG